MSNLSELIEEGKRRRVILKNRKGKPLIDVSLLLAVILIVAAPHILLAVLIGALLEIIDVEVDGQEFSFDGKG